MKFKNENLLIDPRPNFYFLVLHNQNSENKEIQFPCQFTFIFSVFTEIPVTERPERKSLTNIHFNDATLLATICALTHIQ
jgi:hypothetical protein